MHTYRVEKNPFFIGMGVVLGLVTAGILLEDVIQHNAAFTSEHVMSMTVLLATLVAGHNIWPAIREGRYILAIGLVIVAVSGSFLVVTGSAGRAAKHQFANIARAGVVTDTYNETKELLQVARTDYRKLEANFAKECATGKGDRCKGIKETLDAKDTQIRVLQNRLDTLPAPVPADAETTILAQIVGLFVDKPQDRIEWAIGLLKPLAKPGVLEVATLVFMGLGFRHVRVEIPEPKQIPAPETPVEGGELEEATPLLVGPTSPVVHALKQAPRALTNGELAARLGVSQGYASKLVAALVAQGVVEKQMQGREVFIRLKGSLA